MYSICNLHSTTTSLHKNVSRKRFTFKPKLDDFYSIRNFGIPCKCASKTRFFREEFKISQIEKKYSNHSHDPFLCKLCTFFISNCPHVQSIECNRTVLRFGCRFARGEAMSAKRIKGNGNQLQCVFCWFQRMFCRCWYRAFERRENFAFAFRIYRCNLGLARHSCSFIISKFTLHTHTLFTSVFLSLCHIQRHFEVVSWLPSLYFVELLFCFLAFKRKRNWKMLNIASQENERKERERVKEKKKCERFICLAKSWEQQRNSKANEREVNKKKCV